MTELTARVALLLLLAGSATANGAPVGRDQARAAFREARQAYDRGDFEAALAGFERAYALEPLPELLFNIAQAQRHLRRPERAAFFYRRYLEAAKPSPERLALVSTLIEEVEREAALERERALELARAEAAWAEAALRALPEAPSAPPGAVEPGPPLFKRWWFWAGVGVVAAGATAWAVSAGGARQASLGEIRF